MPVLENLLKELVRIPSPNPPGDSREIARFVADWLSDSGAEIRLLHPPEKSQADSVIATLGEGAPVVMLHAHSDTVPIAAGERKRWRSDPFEPAVNDGRLYGKGSVDDKAPLAAMMLAFKKLVESHRRIQGTLLLVAAAEEETGGQLGTRWLVEEGHLPVSDFIIVGEQTDNRVALTHKGVMRATVVTHGHSVHATNPNRGINAITAMAHLVLALERYHHHLRSRQHPLLGSPTCNVGTITGGSTANAVPDSCTVRLDRRMIPGENPEVVKQEIKEVVVATDITPARAELRDFLFSSWFDSDLGTELGRSFLEVVQQFKDPGPIGYLPGSDAKHLMKLRRGDMIIFGPGSYEVAHTFNEYVELTALRECEAILSTFLERVFT